MKNKKAEAWREWWSIIHGRNTPAGSYNPREAHMWEAWDAAWDAALKTTCPPCHGGCNQERDCPARD